MSELHPEIARRRTFAIISHPDAGKTTLTEKLLLYGGAIHLAGEVKARRSTRSAKSDWMTIEKERGISVTTAVMAFPYKECQYNLLDTPGHQDFSEDTFRTVCAADSAIMLIDSAKGVEPQTEKLFQVCRLREMPIFTFINKMDREGRDPLDLFQEVENLLGVHCVAANWPIGQGRDFSGVYDRLTRVAHLFERDDHKGRRSHAKSTTLDDPEIPELIGAAAYEELKMNLELLDAAGEQFDQHKFLSGDITPVFFGSALNSFGVEPFLETFGRLAPSPVARHTREGSHGPENPEFAGFVFKIQANMDKNHRDRVAFFRIVSGHFERGMEALHVRDGRRIKLNNAITFFADERQQVEEGWAGDILGLHDNGQFRIGDTLTAGAKITFDGIPRFCPEKFARVTTPNPLKRKHLSKGLRQLSDEGTVQVLYPPGMGEQNPVLAVVGQLQLEVAKHRLLEEYDVEVGLDPLPYAAARWVTGERFRREDFDRPGISMVFMDTSSRPIVLFRDDWTMKHSVRTNDSVVFHQAAPDEALPV